MSPDSMTTAPANGCRSCSGRGRSRSRTAFRSQADVLVNTRLAADRVGATKMDRPEWGAVDPRTGDVYFTLTNNARRTEKESQRRQSPRVECLRPHHPLDGIECDHASTQFKWSIFLLAGDTTDSRDASGKALPAFRRSCVPGRSLVRRGRRLLIQTDMGESEMYRGRLQPLAATRCSQPIL